MGTIKMLIRRVRRMSEDGYKRLSSKVQLNYKKEVYEPVRSVNLDTNKINHEEALARFISKSFGPGTYDGLPLRGYKKGFGKQAFKVVIMGNYGESMSYEFIHTRGISKYRSFWVPTYE